MPQIKKILVPVTDPRWKPSPAMGRAATLARLFGARVRLFSPVYEQGLAPADGFLKPADVSMCREVLVDLYRKWMDDDLETLARDGVDASGSARWDYPAHDSIVREALRWGADLVVSDTHATKMHHLWSYSNTDWRLIRDCPCPLLLVRNEALPVYETIVACVDPAHAHDKPAALDREILGRAGQFREAIAGDLHVAHAYSLLPIALEGTLLPGAPPPGVDPDTLKKRAAGLLEELTDGTGIPAGNVHLVSGSPEQALPDVLRQVGAELAVMGAVSRSALKRVFIGSTAERLLDRLPCDVLVVKPPGFQTSVKPG